MSKKKEKRVDPAGGEIQTALALKVRVICLVLSVGAIVFAVVLTIGYYEHVVGGRATGCAITSYVDCDKVSSSRFSTVAGIPLSVYGFAFHLFLLGLLVSGFITRARRSQGTVTATILVFTAAGSLVSLALAFISLAVIRALCVYCTALQVLSISVFVVVATQVRVGRAGDESQSRPSIRRIASELRRPRLAVVLIAATIAIAGSALLAVGMENGVFGIGERGISDNADALINLHFGDEVEELSASDSPALGGNDLGVQLIVFSDYNCIHCRDTDSELQRLVDDYDGRIELVFKFFPLDGDCNPFIENGEQSTSCEAAAAAYLAHEQGMFWEYHNELFENYQEYSREELIAYAEDIGVRDPVELASRLDESFVTRRLYRDVLEGVVAGVSYTPTVFLNGRRAESFRGPEDSYYLLLKDTITELTGETP